MGEKQPEHAPRPRIQTLSDLIFGLALSISALTLVGQQLTTAQQLGEALGLYAFSFLILISVWRQYSTITSILPSETSVMVNLNIVLLFFVSIEPYLFNELFVLKGDLFQDVSGLYSIDLAAMFIVITLFYHFLADEEKGLVSKALARRFRLARNFSLVLSIIFLLSIAPYFGTYPVITSANFNLYLRGVLWLVALFIGWSRSLFEILFHMRSG
jgi:uncharacterized membrane protein